MDIILNMIKLNTTNKNILEINLREVKARDRMSAIYMMIYKKKVYIGKSVDVFSRLASHRNQIVKKKHYNKKLLEFDVSKVKCIIIPCMDIDYKERYYINLFKNRLDMVNLIIPSIDSSVTYIYYDKYIIKYKLKSLTKESVRTFHNYIYRDYARHDHKIAKTPRAKKVAIQYFSKLNKIGSIIEFERTRAIKGYFVRFKNCKTAILIHRDIKRLHLLDTLTIKEIERRGENEQESNKDIMFLNI